MGDIEGFQDAELSGPLQVSRDPAMDRMAFNAIACPVPRSRQAATSARWTSSMGST